MTLARGSLWQGTFVGVLKTAVRDILGDGAPFRATVWLEDGGPGVYATIRDATDDGFGGGNNWFPWTDVCRIQFE